MHGRGTFGGVERLQQETPLVREHRLRRIVGNSRRAIVTFALVVPGVFPAAANAQIDGTVVDSEGAPLAGVVVEAWDGGSRLSAVLTHEEGAFSFPSEVAGRTSSLRAARLGYRPTSLPVEGPGSYEIRLEEEPILLSGLVVESERTLCESDEERDARRLWERVRQRYVGPMDTVGIATYLAQADTLVGRDEIGPLSVPPEMRSQRGSSSQLRFSWTRRVRRSGYAFPVRRTDMGRSFDSWAYAPLEADFAPHFVDPVFGDLHEFHIRDSGDFGWVIDFCPEDDDDPSIVGSMRLAPDTTLTSIEWRFQTPEPDEHAGGRAFFPPVTGPPGETYPLPTESIAWRRLPTGDFQEIHQRFERWIVAQGDTVPFLPRRPRR